MLQLFSLLFCFFVGVVQIHAAAREFTFTRVFGDVLNLGGLISVGHERSSISCLHLCLNHLDCFQVEIASSNSTSQLQCRMRNFNTTLQQVPNKDHEYFQLSGVWRFLEIHVAAYSYRSAGPTRSKLRINNRLSESAKRGVNLLTVDLINGKTGAISEFSVYDNNLDAIRMMGYIDHLRTSKLVLISTNDDASHRVNQIATSAAYATLGAKNAVLTFRGCFCLIGCKSCGDDFPVTQVIKKQADSPCECFFRGYVAFDPKTRSVVARGYM